MNKKNDMLNPGLVSIARWETIFKAIVRPEPLSEPTFAYRSDRPRHHSHHRDKEVVWEEMLMIETEKFGQTIWKRTGGREEYCRNLDGFRYYPLTYSGGSQDGKQHKYKTKQGHWTPEEDKILIEIVKVYGPHNWEKNSVHHPSRNGKQMREQWLSCLNGVNKKAFSDIEVATVYYLHDVGKKGWSDISKQLENGRTANSCKNVYHNIVRKKLAKNYEKTAREYIKLYLATKGLSHQVSEVEGKVLMGLKNFKEVEALSKHNSENKVKSALDKFGNKVNLAVDESENQMDLAVDESENQMNLSGDEFWNREDLKDYSWQVLQTEEKMAIEFLLTAKSSVIEP
ncbi:6337_t:CDS:2 [Paraglomus occultum]|uniref:6337_t:CDS:1 n=1 Tax=Paraglomus occultum TaxID=144539 RepID=A0A9N9BUN6_9GLOM|nr:6337_t:CDS:2 [Paraglomus occultum]